jgi:uncharacterized membrane protein
VDAPHMLARDMRMLDGQIMASLQNGTAFFASTSLLAIGGTFALLRATQDVMQVFATLPLGIETTLVVWETKVIACSSSSSMRSSNSPGRTAYSITARS